MEVITTIVFILKHDTTLKINEKLKNKILESRIKVIELNNSYGK